MLLSERTSDFNPRFDVSACFCEADGKILLLHRQDHKPQGDTWAVPAGKVHTGESPEQAIIRELEEEIGVRIPGEKLEFVQSVLVRYVDYDYVYHMHKTVLDSEDIELNLEEHKDHRWVTAEEALTFELIEDEDSCLKIVYGLK